MKLVLRLLAAFAAITVLGFAFLALKKPAQRAPLAEKIEPTPARLARGEYLVRGVTGCLGCHSQLDFATYAMPTRPGTEGQGGLAFGPEYGVPGTVQAQNITADAETGIGAWTDGEVLRAMREGIAKDGSALFPMMPYESYRNLSDEDAKSIVAYVRTLPAVRHPIKPRELSFPVNFLVKLVPQPLREEVPQPDDATDHQAYGKYLVTIGGCRDCHTAHDAHGKLVPGADFAGGWEMKYPGGRVFTSNITPHESTWLGQVSKDEFIGRFRSWKDAPDVPAVKGRNTTMSWKGFASLTDKDLGAIYDYLRSVPGRPGVVNPFPDASAQELAAGH
jgi:cytochrome c